MESRNVDDRIRSSIDEREGVSDEYVPNIPEPQLERCAHEEFTGRLFWDIWDAIINDRFMFIVIWSPPRLGKTSLAMWLLYSIYRDWTKVLQATVFDLPQTISRLRRGLPERWCTRNGLHWRVPILNWDDFGAHSNKAETQSDPAFDLFKGGFDVLATKVGVLIATMVDPNEPTFQLLSKYTHELHVIEKGHAKYDQVVWQQNFSGFKTRIKKVPIEPIEFGEIPREVYKEYDLSRMSLCDEVFVRIDDAIAENSVDKLMKMLKPSDLNLLLLIDEHGPASSFVIHHHFEKGDSPLKPEQVTNIITRCKARNLIAGIAGRDSGQGVTKYELSEVALQVIEKCKKKDADVVG